MTVGDIAQKLWNGVLALFGKKPPAKPSQTEVQMAFEKVQAAVQELEDALTRAAANAAAQAQAVTDAQSAEAAAQSALADAEDQIVNLLQPAVDQANALAPAPPPPPPPPPAA